MKRTTKKSCELIQNVFIRLFWTVHHTLPLISFRRVNPECIVSGRTLSKEFNGMVHHRDWTSGVAISNYPLCVRFVNLAEKE